MSLSSSEIFSDQHDNSFGKVLNTDSDSQQTVFMAKELYREQSIQTQNTMSGEIFEIKNNVRFIKIHSHQTQSDQKKQQKKKIQGQNLKQIEVCSTGTNPKKRVLRSSVKDCEVVEYQYEDSDLQMISKRPSNFYSKKLAIIPEFTMTRESKQKLIAQKMRSLSKRKVIVIE